MLLLDVRKDLIKKVKKDYPYRMDEFMKSLLNDQMKQHLWWKVVLNQIADLPKGFSVNVYASGYTTHIIPFLISLGAGRINLFDFDKEVCELNWIVADYYKNKAVFSINTMDVIFDIEWIDKNVDLVINTSCEVMYHFKRTLNRHSTETAFVLQGTNKPKKGNINISHSLDSFIVGTGVTDVWHQGVLKDSDYERYMVIGK